VLREECSGSAKIPFSSHFLPSTGLMLLQPFPGSFLRRLLCCSLDEQTQNAPPLSAADLDNKSHDCMSLSPILSSTDIRHQLQCREVGSCISSQVEMEYRKYATISQFVKLERWLTIYTNLAT
jgi:hypothetical protein